jgi:formiminotetrahydrofolate cyclodeaminase
VEEATAQPSNFAHQSLGEFVDRLASSDPVPGGGSASAVAAAVAAGLVAMVARLSEGRPKYAAHAELHRSSEAAGRRLADAFLSLAGEDAIAYGRFADALKLPRETDEQRQARAAALRTAARDAAEVPLATVEACQELVRLTESLAGRSNQNASSDLSVAALLGEAAAHGAAQNVLVNLPAIGDEDVAGSMAARVDELLTDIERASRATRDMVRAGTLR